MKNKRFIGLILTVAIATVFIVPYFVAADDPFTNRRHSWTAKQWFRKAVEFFDNIDFTGADIDIDSSSTFDIACPVNFTDGVYIGDELVTESYDRASTSGALTWAYANGNTLYTSGSTGITVTLPAITSATDGYRLTVKNTSGSAARTVTPNNADYIESMPGVMTGTADACIAYPGDMRTWEADYQGSATSGVWKLVDSKCIIRNEMTKKGSAVTTAGGAQTWGWANGNIVTVTGTTTAVLTLPTITSYMTGFELTFKMESGSTVTLTPASGVDAIEATQGTMTATSDSDLNAVGDSATFWACYSSDASGASSVWYIKQEDIT